MKNIAVFGSTGSIGTQTLSVCEMHPDLFNVSAIVFGGNSQLGIEQIKMFSPKYIGVFNGKAAEEAARAFPDAEIVSGEKVWELASVPEIDVVVNGVSGFNGIFPLINALDAGKTVALANKESVVCAGDIVRASLEKGVGAILPVDSE